MPANNYAEIAEASCDHGRERERDAFDHGIALMRAATEDAKDARTAARFMQDLWSYLIRDLTNPTNDLSVELKANLISIGLWVIKETDAIVSGTKKDWGALIDINTTVREGLA